VVGTGSREENASKEKYRMQMSYLNWIRP
jgi:hypothetical protein